MVDLSLAKMAQTSACDKGVLKRYLSVFSADPKIVRVCDRAKFLQLTLVGSSCTPHAANL